MIPGSLDSLVEETIVTADYIIHIHVYESFDQQLCGDLRDLVENILILPQAYSSMEFGINKIVKNGHFRNILQGWKYIAHLI